MTYLEKAKSLKEQIKFYHIWLASHHCDGWEKIAIQQTLDRLKQQQYQLAQQL